MDYRKVFFDTFQCDINLFIRRDGFAFGTFTQFLKMEWGYTHYHPVTRRLQSEEEFILDKFGSQASNMINRLKTELEVVSNDI